MESDRLFIGHNLMFDLTVLYKQDIWPKHVYDTMIAEQLIYLGYPRVLTKELYDLLNINYDCYEWVPPKDTKSTGSYKLAYSLQATAQRRIGVYIDKSVRGAIITKGLTEDVVEYAGKDVKYLEAIKDAQEIILKEQGLLEAIRLECTFIKFLAYTKFCGVYLNPKAWMDKMNKDKDRLEKATKALNDWVVSFIQSQGANERSKSLKVQHWSIFKGKEINTPVLPDSTWIRKLEVPEGILVEYEVPIDVSKFVYRNLQGSLFDGFDTNLKCAINWSSSKQVVKLFELLGIKVETFAKKTKKKKKSIEEKQISPQKEMFSIIPLFIEYQKADKVVSTYGQNWLNAINPKTGRIHVELHPIGTDTSRVASGGGPYKLNQQNLPSDSTTRACFQAEPGNVWISCDYQSQESRIIASVSNDKAMIDLFERGCGDVHSLVAYMSYPNIIPRDTKIEDIKKLYHKARQEAKAIEFAVNYGGDANTIQQNSGIPIEQAQEIYNNFMKGFPGIDRYQKDCKAEVMKKGYIIMNNVFMHRAHIFDAEWLFKMQEKMKDSRFWSYYREMKKVDSSCDTVQQVTRYFKRKSDCEKQSVNYRIQDRGAMAFKLAAILLFNWIVEHRYQNIVKVCVVAHDEFNLECPEEMAEEVSSILVKCMIKGGEPFCPNVFLGADLSRYSICTENFIYNGELIMSKDDIIDISSEKFLHNRSTNKKYILKDLTKEVYSHLDDKGPFPIYWIH